jgi:hypothetical protein
LGIAIISDKSGVITDQPCDINVSAGIACAAGAGCAVRAYSIAYSANTACGGRAAICAGDSDGAAFCVTIIDRA